MEFLIEGTVSAVSVQFQGVLIFKAPKLECSFEVVRYFYCEA